MKVIHDVVCRCVRLGVLVVMCSVSQTAVAAQGVIVKNAWARATAPGQTTASVYMEIVSAADAALVGAASPRARSAGIHAMRTEGGVMKMRAVPKLALPAQKSVKLAPGGLHIMLVGIDRPLGDNERVPVELTIESARGASSTVRVEAEVRTSAVAAPPHTH
jgi:copper(I)-binding protein